MVAGEVIFKDGKFAKVDKNAVMEELAASLQVPLTSEEERRRQLSREVFPYVKKFYDGWLDDSTCHPFYCQSSRH